MPKSLRNRDVYTIAELWTTYQDKKVKGTDEAYIVAGDYVLVQTKDYMDSQGIPLTNEAREHYGEFMPVVASCKVAEDLWYTTVSTQDGKDLILYDDEIMLVFKPSKVYRVFDEEWSEIMGTEQLKDFAVSQICNCPDDFLEDNIKGYYVHEKAILDLADRVLNKNYTDLTLEEVNIVFDIRHFEYEEIHVR